MSLPVWLTEFHRQWHAARGGRTESSSRGFSRDWQTLLTDSGITRAEDQATAVREAEALGRFVLKRHKFRRYIIERITLPSESEEWLRGYFGRPAAIELRDAALAVVNEFMRRQHPRFPNEWAALCQTLEAKFSQSSSLRPFTWRDPANLRYLLETTFSLSAREWAIGTPIRAASVEIGLDSKALERHQRSFESALVRLFGTAICFKSLGFVSGDSFVELSGPLMLHFPDGTVQEFEGLTNILISATDLARCSRISTTAERLLTIENRKTTFRQFASANHDRRTLLAATSFPTPAFRDFLGKLPGDLPHHHFGDTDPAGWQILAKLREANSRGVSAFRMNWRAGKHVSPLTPYDQLLLPKLINTDLLADVRPEICVILQRQDRGDFEQESLGSPDLDGWPFLSLEQDLRE